MGNAYIAIDFGKIRKENFNLKSKKAILLTTVLVIALVVGSVAAYANSTCQCTTTNTECKCSECECK